MADDAILPHSIDDMFASSGIGSLDKAIGNSLYGINHRQTPSAIPSNKDTYGLTFFVRPQLNLQTDNIRNNRILYQLLSNEPLSVQAVIRNYLDPRLMAGYKSGNFNVPAIQNSLVDNQQAFFPFLTNGCSTVSGWPDVTLPVFTSRPGLYKETFSMADGLVKNYADYTVDASFRNTLGDPTLMLIHVWLHYMSAVKEGKMVPYLDYIATNTLDYCSRIYRFTLDQQKNTITKAFCSGYSFPVSNPTGSFADFNKENPYNDQNKDITIRFQCQGFEAMDDIILSEFNKTVIIFNPDMADGRREASMIKLSKLELSYFNHRGYPRVNYDTYELEWWVPMDMYQSRAQQVINATTSPKDQFGTGESDPGLNSIENAPLNSIANA